MSESRLEDIAGEEVELVEEVAEEVGLGNH